MTFRDVYTCWRGRRDNPIARAPWNARRVVFLLCYLTLCVAMPWVVYYYSEDRQILIQGMQYLVLVSVPLLVWLAFALCIPRRYTDEQLEELGLTLLSRQEVVFGVLWPAVRAAAISGLTLIATIAVLLVFVIYPKQYLYEDKLLILMALGIGAVSGFAVHRTIQEAKTGSLAPLVRRLMLVGFLVVILASIITILRTLLEDMSKSWAMIPMLILFSTLMAIAAMLRLTLGRSLSRARSFIQMPVELVVALVLAAMVESIIRHYLAALYPYDVEISGSFSILLIGAALLRVRQSLTAIEHRLYAGLDRESWRREHWLADQSPASESPEQRLSLLNQVRQRARGMLAHMFPALAIGFVASLLTLAMALRADEPEYWRAWSRLERMRPLSGKDGFIGIILGSGAFPLWLFLIVPVWWMLAARHRRLPLPRGLMMAGLGRVLFFPGVIVLLALALDLRFLMVYGHSQWELLPHLASVAVSAIVTMVAVGLALLPRRGRVLHFLAIFCIYATLSLLWATQVRFSYVNGAYIPIACGVISLLLIPTLAQRAHREEFAMLERWEMPESEL